MADRKFEKLEINKLQVPPYQRAVNEARAKKNW